MTIKHNETKHLTLDFVGKILRLYISKHQDYLVKGTQDLLDESQELRELFLFLNKEVLGDATHGERLLDLAHHYARYGTPWESETTTDTPPFSFRPLKELLEENLAENNENQ